MNIIEKLVAKIRKQPYMLKQGAGYLSKRNRCTVEEVNEAKRIYRESLTEGQKSLKILLLDIETAPMKAYVWKRWKENISLDQTISEWFMLCWSAKWLYSEETMGECLTPDEVANEDDSRIMRKLWTLLDEAVVVVTHNGNKFDLPKINSRLLMNDLPPYKPVFSVDTCKVCKYTFGFSSNKLDALAGYFGFDHKLKTDFDLWKKCMEGDEESLNYMLEYNKMDVIILEDVYLKLRPYIKGHPNTNLFMAEQGSYCCSCGSKDIEEVEGKYYYTSVGKYKLYRCSHCGSLSRGREAVNRIKDIELTSVGK